MPFVSIRESPLIPDISPVSIHYRDSGQGAPLIFLHGGWGYEIYPFDRQINALAGRRRILIPDRSGYGGSMRIDKLPTDFHHRAAVEMSSFLDELKIDKPILWGHSDGAVIAILMALNNPSRFPGLILEAFHYYRVKDGSRAFFEAMSEDPNRLGERVCATLSREHGEDYWRHLILLNGKAWLGINHESNNPKEDLYGGRLSEIKPPALFIHGSRDPRTEPDEMEKVAAALPHAIIHMVENGGHSPHSESAAFEETTHAAEMFLEQTALA